jgi:predicted outer membrane protein
MRRKLFLFSNAFLLAAGLMLTATPSAKAQTGMPGTPQAGVTSSRVLAERSLAGALLSDVRAQTSFSKLALKKSGDSDVKKLAKKTISENDKLAAELATLIAGFSQAGTDVYNFGRTTRQARDAEKRMSKLTGTEFDKAYLSEMAGYLQNDQKKIGDNSQLIDSPEMRRVTARMQAMSERHLQLIHQAAQS